MEKINVTIEETTWPEKKPRNLTKVQAKAIARAATESGTPVRFKFRQGPPLPPNVVRLSAYRRRKYGR
jgi:hypothetical protein